MRSPPHRQLILGFRFWSRRGCQLTAMAAFCWSIQQKIPHTKKMGKQVGISGADSSPMKFRPNKPPSDSPIWTHQSISAKIPRINSQNSSLQPTHRNKRRLWQIDSPKKRFIHATAPKASRGSGSLHVNDLRVTSNQGFGTTPFLYLKGSTGDVFNDDIRVRRCFFEKNESVGFNSHMGCL